MLLTAPWHHKQEPLETWVPEQSGVGGIILLLHGFMVRMAHRTGPEPQGEWFADLNHDRPPPESLPGSPCDPGWGHSVAAAEAEPGLDPGSSDSPGPRRLQLGTRSAPRGPLTPNLAH